jgi:hypothetical protein
MGYCDRREVGHGEGARGVQRGSLTSFVNDGDDDDS